MKITNNWEGRNYLAQKRAMEKYHKVKTVKNFFIGIIKRILILALVVGAIFAFYEYTRLNNPLIKVQIQEREVLIDNLGPKIDELKAEVLDTLQKCESQGANEDTGLIVFDSNKVASIGLYQFQKATVIGYYKALYNKDITGKEAIEIALDGTQARKLASDIIFTAGPKDKGINNWFNCNNKNGLGAKVAFINKISK